MYAKVCKNDDSYFWTIWENFNPTNKEHLDGMGSIMFINLDETIITDRIVEVIVSTFLESNKMYRKIAFVGVNSSWKRKLSNIKKRGIVIQFISDYEKAKEWLFF